ncbi:nitronate monooxygenase [Paracoccus sp. DMF-8]|uniref:NAD(P)H-dependent flavin oxidoreductase n=1 Tax=Paracoccus sp. DMF-8 TaxID=3019445 RepID=UPI0023E81CFB|nr:nitronate monooxygenase [Paracoccus sp. DMF-8]MDF3604788.1 nitronate monooxygenase [Paracoccus sp. DMF-8]
MGVETFTFFWDVMPDIIARVKTAGARVLHQIGTVEAARQAEAAGADVLIAQGVEAGGHIHGEVAMLSLVEALAARSTLPVVASGGIASGAGLVAALAAGAQGVQIGTAFLATVESYAHEYHKDRVVAAEAGDTLRTDLFVLNWPAHSAVRVLANSTTKGLGYRPMGHDPDQLPREVIASEGARPIYRYSTDSPIRETTGNLEAMALFAGQGVGAVTDIPTAGERLRAILAEGRAVLARLAEQGRP